MRNSILLSTLLLAIQLGTGWSAIAAAGAAGTEPGSRRAQLVSEIRLLDALTQGRDRAYRVLVGLSGITPPEVYLTRVTEQDGRFRVEGVAASNARIAALLRRIDDDPNSYFHDPELDQIDVRLRDGIRSSRFLMTVRERRVATPVAASEINLADPQMPFERLVRLRGNYALHLDAAKSMPDDLMARAERFGARLDYAAPAVLPAAAGALRYEEAIYPVTISGSYSAVVRFLDDVRLAATLVTWDQFAIDSAPQPGGSSPLITMTARAHIYRAVD